MGLGGLFLALCFVILPALFFYRVSNEYLAQLRASDELPVYEKYTTERLTTLENRKNQTAAQKNKLQEQLDKLTAESKGPANSVELDKLQSRLDEVNRELKSIEDNSFQMSFDLALRQIDAKNDEQLSINQSRNARVLLVLGVILGIAFSVVSIKGFKQWGKRLKGVLIEETEADAQIQAKTQADKPEQVKLAQPKLDPVKFAQKKVGPGKLEYAELEQTKPEQVTIAQPKLGPGKLEQAEFEQTKLEEPENLADKR